MFQRSVAICLLLLSGIAIGAALTTAADAAPWLPHTASTDSAFASEIAAASQRFGIPEAWIRAVIRAESGGNTFACSRVGARGLMQLMPATWEALTHRLGLGGDPFDPHDNIFAGTAYLREMYDRFGASGVLAAYNAGPGRYTEHLATARPLPAETRAYVATVTAYLTAMPQTGDTTARPAQELSPPRPAPIAHRSDADGIVSPPQPAIPLPVPVTHDLSGLTPLSTGLFVPTGSEETPQ